MHSHHVMYIYHIFKYQFYRSVHHVMCCWEMYKISLTRKFAHLSWVVSRCFKIYIMLPSIHIMWCEYCSFHASCDELPSSDELLENKTSYYLQWNNAHLACVVSSCFNIYPCLHITWCEYEKFLKIEFIDQYIRWCAAEKCTRFLWHENAHIFL